MAVNEGILAGEMAPLEQSFHIIEMTLDEFRTLMIYQTSGSASFQDPGPHSGLAMGA